MEQTKRKFSANRLLTILAVLAVAVSIPRLSGGYSQMVFNIALIQSITALGISVMLGMGGILSYANVSFMGIGAFIMANLTSGRQGFIMNSGLALVVSVCASVVCGLVFGMILLRLKGTYFTFATIGLVQVMFAVFINFRPLSNGPDGISGVPALRIFGWTPKSPTQWFYLLMAICLGVALLVEQIRRTQLGRSLAAIRDNEVAAQTLGVPIYFTKVVAFVIAATLGGLAGALYASYNGFVSADLFTFNMATTYIIMVMLGGVNNTKGVIVGALLVSMLPEWLRPMQKYLRLIYGVGVVLLMVFMPMGMSGVVTSLQAKLKRSKRKGVDVGASYPET